MHDYVFNLWQVLRERGQGFGILVSKFPKDTNASYSLQAPSEVFLLEGKRTVSYFLM